MSNNNNNKNKPKLSLDELRKKFIEVCQKSVEDQIELFLKSFIFALGDDWKKIGELAKAYKKYVAEGPEDEPDLNFVQASDFLQRNGQERTAQQRKDEIADIDLDNNNRICFIEFLLLRYKKMILEEYYKRTGEKCNVDLSRGGVGVSGVGRELLDELFTMPSGLPPELERALEELTAAKKKRAAFLDDLKQKASAGGVKGGIASATLAQELLKEDPEQLRVEAKINSQLMKCKKGSGAAALKKKQDQEKKEADAKAKASKDALKARLAAFQ